MKYSKKGLAHYCLLLFVNMIVLLSVKRIRLNVLHIHFCLHLVTEHLAFSTLLVSLFSKNQYLEILEFYMMVIERLELMIGYTI